MFLQSEYPEVMSTTLPPSISLVIPSPRVSIDVDEELQAIAIQVQQELAEVATEPTPTPNYARPPQLSCFRLKRRTLTKRFTELLRSAHLKKRKIEPLDLPMNQPDDVPEESPRIIDTRGRSLTSKLPSGIKPPSLYDDGQGDYTDEYGYIYRSGIDMSISHLSLGSGVISGGAGKATRPSSGEPDGRVDSRVPKGSLGAAGDDLKEQEPEDTGSLNQVLEPRVLDLYATLEAAKHVSETGATETVLESHEVLVDGDDDGNTDAGCSCDDARGCCSDAGDDQCPE
jgi:hypothetical protein